MSRRRVVALVSLALIACVITGCGRRRSAVLLERSAVGPVERERGAAQEIAVELTPPTVVVEKDGVEMTATYASHDYLRTYFQNKTLFGQDAGLNPYFAENLVLYVRIANRSDQKIRIDPTDCVLLDNLNNQYQYLPMDTLFALAEYKAPVASFTRSTLREARPGYFGVSVPAGGIMAGFVGSGRQQLTLLKQVNLNPGYLYPGVVYDGFIAFWTPHQSATSLRLVWPIKSHFAPDDRAQKTIEVMLPFTIAPRNRHGAAPSSPVRTVTPSSDDANTPH